MGSEKCQKCGEIGEDRRTLWMACFYKMDEMPVPFEEVQIKGTLHERVEVRQETWGPFDMKFDVSVFNEEPMGPKTDHRFYRLRVCKDCRASWMGAIRTWFEAPVKQEASCGSGIFIRENGINKEITLDEWKRRAAEREYR